MKKIISLLFVTVALCGLLYGCQKETVTLIPYGKYYMQNCTERAMTPYVSFYSKNGRDEFTFVYSVVSSYIPYGTYSVKDSVLTLTDSNGNIFKFNIDGANLIFLADESSSITEFNKVPTATQGSIFTLENSK